MPTDLVNLANVVVSCILTGFVYGLMALGLSVIFGVARVINFAHGEIMTLAMYAAVVSFGVLDLDPFFTVLPIAIVFFAFGYGLQSAVINRFITRPEHSQFMLLLAIAVIMTNALLIVFGPDARNVQLDHLLESIEVGPLLVDRGKFYAALIACAVSAALFGFFRFSRTGTAIRACADNWLGAKVVGLDVKRLGRRRRLQADPASRSHAWRRAGVHPARVRDRDRRRSRLDDRRARRGNSDRPVRGDGGTLPRALGQRHV
jgi:branched-chain amino acid transport system permease protein